MVSGPRHATDLERMDGGYGASTRHPQTVREYLRFTDDTTVMTTPTRTLISEPSTVTLVPSATKPGPQVLCPNVGGPVMLYNADILNVVYAGYRSEVTAQNGTPIQPLTFIVIDASRQIYGYNGNNANVMVNVTPGGTAQSPSAAQIATQISLTGVGLLRNEVPITNGATTPVAIGANTTIGPFPMNSPSYELVLTLTATAAVAVANGEVSLKWSNSTGVAILAQKSFSVVASTGGHTITISGPVRGSSLSVTFAVGTTSATTITFSYRLVGSSRLAANDLCRTLTTVGAGPPTGVTWAGTNNGDAGVLGNATPSLATGASTNRGLLMYNGPVTLQANSTSAANDMEILLQAFDPNFTVNYGNVFDGFSDAHGEINTSFQMPMYQCLISLINHNAATKTLSFLITTAEPNVN